MGVEWGRGGGLVWKAADNPAGWGSSSLQIHGSLSCPDWFRLSRGRKQEPVGGAGVTKRDALFVRLECQVNSQRRRGNCVDV